LFANRAFRGACRSLSFGLFAFLAFFYPQTAEASASSPPAWLGLAFSRPDSPVTVEARRVVEHSTFQKSVERFRLRSAPAVFEFLLDHPDFAASVVRELQIAHYRITPRSDGGYDAEDMQGVRGSFQPFYSARGERAYLGVGTYRSRFLPSFTGHAVVRLRYRPRLDPKGRPYVENHAEVYVRLDNRFVAFFTKLLMPFLHRVVDQKLERALSAAQRLSAQIAMNPKAVYDRLSRSPEMDRATLEAFRQLLDRDRQEAARRAPDSAAHPLLVEAAVAR
jgi:hypothetical protein